MGEVTHKLKAASNKVAGKIKKKGAGSPNGYFPNCSPFGAAGGAGGLGAVVDGCVWTTSNTLFPMTGGEQGIFACSQR